jgi:methyltransferase FkbM-like protein
VFDVLASTSSEFIETTTAAGRFEPAQWTGGTLDVRVTTLDAAIAVFGVPAFTKIDIEGAEPEALAGLSVALPALSFEFTGELLHHVDACLEHLDRIGSCEVAVSTGEDLVVGPWMPTWALRAQLDELHGDPLLWGDVYARRL